MGSRGSTVGFLFAEEDKEKVGMSGYLCTGAFYLDPGLTLWLNWQFLISHNCFEAIFLFRYILNLRTN
jgi:hypothetical protein